MIWDDLERGSISERAAGSQTPSFPVVIGAGSHPFPFRTRKLRLLPPMVLRAQVRGRVGRCRGYIEGLDAEEASGPFLFLPTGRWSVHPGGKCRRAVPSAGSCTMPTRPQHGSLLSDIACAAGLPCTAVPELPDIELYLHALRPRLVGRHVVGVRLASPFLVRSTLPPLEAIVDRTVHELRRIGKRVAIVTDGPCLVIHLMIAGRLQWRPPRVAIPRRLGLLAIDTEQGTLLLTEAGTTRRASVHMTVDRAALALLDPGGLEVLGATLDEFLARLTSERHTLKRALTDPSLFSGIGNAYSDEILHRARLSPLRLTDALAAVDAIRLFEATTGVLTEWRDRLIGAAGDAFPAKVTAFREGMAVHGRYGQPCPVCGTPIQRVRYAANEANYCPTCQTGGRLLADRGLSRLLRQDWPKTLEELERLKTSRRLG
jgi:formamidopyrimidine-DNA glycosylase